MAQAAIPMIMAVTAAAQVSQAHQASNQQKRLAEANMRKQDEMLAAAEAQKNAERKAMADAESAAEETANANALRNKQKAMSNKDGGRAGTILTNPLDEVANVTATNKTLLGA